MSSDNDINLPKISYEKGSAHPINQIKDSILSLLNSFGFQIIDGPEIETEKYNFDMLNIKESHPARQMHDTFYIKDKEYVLRTHTSPVQIRTMLENKPPMAFISGGKVYRKDDDATHLPMFHQIEGIIMEPGANLGMLVSTLKTFYAKMGYPEVRVRPAYFPYTEPSLEIEVKWRGKWLELGGAGIFRPEVTEPLGIKDPVCAWGMGLEILAMLVLGLDDIRQLYISDLEWLRNQPIL